MKILATVRLKMATNLKPQFVKNAYQNIMPFGLNLGRSTKLYTMFHSSNSMCSSLKIVWDFEHQVLILSLKKLGGWWVGKP